MFYQVVREAEYSGETRLSIKVKFLTFRKLVRDKWFEDGKLYSMRIEQRKSSYDSSSLSES